MSWTKRQFVTQAFSEIGYASYAFDLEPEQLEMALRRLDSMMAMWNGKGVRLSYPIPSSPELSDLDDETNVPDSANEAIYTNLAIRIAPTVGKLISKETRDIARSGYKVLLARATTPPVKQPSGDLPLGAGYKSLDRRFVNPPTDPVLAGSDGELEFD